MRRIPIDRQTVYAGASPACEDILYNAQYALTGLGLLALDLMGVGPLVYGAAITQVGDTDGFSIAPGRIYVLDEIDATAWSSLPINSNLIIKQGISWDAEVVGCPPPVTFGDSINYLIQCQYADSDINPMTPSYYNADAPLFPFSGAGNDGQAQPTTRTGEFQFGELAGTAAATGTQTTPSPTAGWYPLAVVTATYGGTWSIAIPVGAPYANASFTMGSTGLASGTTTGTAYYSISGGGITLTLPVIAGVSNADSFTLTGLPTILQPAAGLLGSNNQVCPVALAQNSGAYVAGAYASIAGASGIVSLGLLGSLTGWGATGTKSVAGTISYRIF